MLYREKKINPDFLIEYKSIKTGGKKMSKQNPLKILQTLQTFEKTLFSNPLLWKMIRKHENLEF